MAADSGMNTCPSPEIADSRKRPLDGDSENGDIKRSHFSSGGDGTYHFKVLVPSMAAGAIIGKGGETIAQLQKDTGSRVKMSKSHDFYPGTSERVCMITGSVEAIMTVLEFIMDKIREKPDFVKPFTEADTKLSQDRDRQVKILVPNSTAGMIIGKGGVYIKQMKEQSGSYVQISQKAKDVSLQERCITVLGDKEQNKIACMMILQKVVDDPLSGSCPNTSYAAMAGPVANFNPTGSPYAHNQQEVDISQGHALTSSVLTMNGASAGTLNLTLNLGAPTLGGSPLSQQMLDHIKLSLRNFGYTELACQEICAALGLLGKHGVLGLGLGGAPASLPPQLPPAPLPQHAYFPMHDQSAMFGTIGQVSLGLCGSPSPTTRGSLERFADVASFEAAFRPQAVAPISLNGGFGLSAGGGVPAALLPISKSPTPGDMGAKDTKNVEIPEVIVGAILGPGGKSLTEIQKMSGANIQISKKGTFAPGTRNRIVTITGSIGAISNAHCLIEQKIQEEELKRTRHNALSGIMQ